MQRDLSIKPDVPGISTPAEIRDSLPSSRPNASVDPDMFADAESDPGDTLVPDPARTSQDSNTSEVDGSSEIESELAVWDESKPLPPIVEQGDTLVATFKKKETPHAEYIRNHLRTSASSPHLRTAPPPPALVHKPSQLKLAASHQKASSLTTTATSWLGGLLDKVLEIVDPGYDELSQPSLDDPTSPTTTPLATDSIPTQHFKKALFHLNKSPPQHSLALSEFTLAATLGPDPHPESIRLLVQLYSDPSLPTFNQAKAVEWTQTRLMVLGTPDGMLAQAKFLRGDRGLFRDLNTPTGAEGKRWRMDVKEDMEAALLVRQAAASGLPPAVHAYAVYLKENGRGVEAMGWFEKAFEQGVWESGRWIADGYEKGIIALVAGETSLEPDLELAEAWTQKVEEWEIRVQLAEETKRKQEEDERLRYKEESDFLAFKQRRKEDEWKRQELEAEQRRENDATLKSILKYLETGYFMIAVDELCNLSRAGNADAQEFLDPDITPFPRDKAYSGPAMNAFAIYFAKRNDPSRASRWFRNAAEVGYADAQFMYASYLVSGRGMSCEDPGQSIVWLMKAWSGSQHKEAAMALGDAFTKGVGVTPDPQKALVWYERAWQTGRYIEAAFACGLAHATGYTPGYVKPVSWSVVADPEDQTVRSSSSPRPKVQPVPRSFETAVKWYERAAKLGHARSCNNLGEMFMMGRGVARNEFAGLQYFKRAAAEGLPQAMYNCGRSYRDGRGCVRSETAALEWFRRALEYGVKEAQIAIDESKLYAEDDLLPTIGLPTL
ncbi:hypothetical protein HDU98_008422 [Podochytrium sp. JEL0797]|nr:hypothetical protein HDU98_008422 [Podochytrium sp. JEL0797]